MSKAIDVLMREHRVIERVTASLETFAEELGRGAPLERFRAAEFAEFFGRFADACHHGKEEDLLFRTMIERGFPRESGPIAVMLHEHTVGRRHVGVLRGVGAGAGPASAPEREAFSENALAFAPFLRAHIVKEDRILYPMALQVLPAPVLDRLAEQYDEFDRKAMGDGALEQLLGLAEKLTAAYPFDPAKLEVAFTGFGCH